VEPSHHVTLAHFTSTALALAPLCPASFDALVSLPVQRDPLAHLERADLAL